jgi:predicted Zn-ribbon and HTH transcriptional regulator
MGEGTMGTIRQSIIFVLKEQEWTAKDISQAVGIREKEVYDHLVHIARSRSLGGKFILLPSVCRDCGHVFKKRDRLTPPSRCFLCRSEAISPPRFSIRIEPSKENARGKGDDQFGDQGSE